ncbi:MAG: hypothetical protein NVSMB27_50570 [Ktedonobacteraceae bacterium]
MENTSSQQHTDRDEQWEEGGERAILAGNAYQDGMHHTGWFIGHFLGPAVSIRYRPNTDIRVK